jgi:hypothetical protein
MPARVLLQDFTGVPRGTWRRCAARRGGARRRPGRINPLRTVELVIDHLQVDYFGRADAFAPNAELEFSRPQRYALWGQQAFNNFKVVPPDTGIVHQATRASGAWCSRDRERQDGGVSRHAGQHRLAHDEGWRPGRRWRGGRHRPRRCRPAQLDAHPEVLGVRLTGAMPRG